MKKQILVTFTLFFVLGFIVSILLSLDKERRIKMYLENQLLMSSTQFDVTYKNYNNLSKSIYNNILTDSEIVGLIDEASTTTSKETQDKLRLKLQSSLTHIYQNWNAIGINQLHFHLKNNVSFLRMHAPSKFGDDLTKARYSVATVNKTLQPIDGLEMGKIDNGFRFVYPLFNSNKHIGSVEVSVSVIDFLQKIEDSFHAKVGFSINKQVIEHLLVHSEVKNMYELSPNSPYYLRLKRDIGKYGVTQIPKNIRNEISQKLLQNKPFYVYYKTKSGDSSVITFLPIKNVQGNRAIAYIAKHTDGKYIDELESDYYLVLAMMLIILAGILFYGYKDYMYKKNITKSFDTIRVQKEELAHSVEELERQNIQITASIDENRKKDNLIAEQSRLASLGEMIGNIAHQWRQPLSAISTSASSLSVQNELGILNPNELNPALNKIIEKTQFLSQTIEDFRNFIEGKKEKKEFVISSAIDNALNVIDSSIANSQIIIKKDYAEIIFINNFKNEFIQGILNIINNAKDVLNERNENIEKVIFISVKKFKNKAIVTIQDNAGGINADILSRVFEPYFTTKHKSQGTGLGLYMTHQIITTSMGGNLLVDNHEFIHNDNRYFGARFIIELLITNANETNMKDEEADA